MPLAVTATSLDEAATVGQTARRSPTQTQHPRRSHVSVESVLAVQRMVRAVNDYRRSIGLRELAWNERAADAAGYQADRNARDAVLSHESADGQAAPLYLRNAGVAWQGWGENLALGTLDAQWIVALWDQSPGHRQVLQGNYTHMGVALRYTANGIPVWVLMLYR